MKFNTEKFTDYVEAEGVEKLTTEHLDLMTLDQKIELLEKQNKEYLERFNNSMFKKMYDQDIAVRLNKNKEQTPRIITKKDNVIRVNFKKEN